MTSTTTTTTTTPPPQTMTMVADALHGEYVCVRRLLEGLVDDVLRNGSNGLFDCWFQLFQEDRPVFVQDRVHAVTCTEHEQDLRLLSRKI